MKFADIFGAEEAGIRRYSNDDKPKRAEIAPFERVRITLVTLSERMKSLRDEITCGDEIRVFTRVIMNVGGRGSPT